MKKAKLLGTILLTIVPSSVITTLVGCVSKNVTTKREISLDSGSKAKIDVTKNDDSGIVVTLIAIDQTQIVKSVAIKIGNDTLEQSEYTFENGKVTITKEVLEKHPGKIVITPTIEDKVIQSISVKTSEINKNITEQLTVNDIEVTITYEDKTQKTNAVYNTDYQVYKENESDPITLPYHIPDTSKIGSDLKFLIKSTKNPHVSTILIIKIVAIKVTNVIITNSQTLAKVNEKLELTATVEPNNATNKELKWSVTPGTGEGEIITENNKTYLKGTKVGTVTITAIAKDNSGVSASKEFTIIQEIKTINLSFDEQSFKDYDITISNTPTKITSENEETKKIIFNYNQKNPSSIGFLKLFKIDGNSLIERSKVINLTTTTGQIEFTFTNWSEITSNDTKIKVVYMSNNFNGKSISVLNDACKTFEANTPQISDAQTLCTALGVTNPKKGTDAMTTLENNLVALEGELIINNQIHTFRCIGAMHDMISNSNNKAALTFELVTLLSDNSGKAMTSEWNKDKEGDNYTNSKLRKNLTGEGGGTASFSSTVLSMLPTELQSSIKSVTKNIVTKSGEEEYIDASYNDKLFPLTYTEMALSGSSYAKTEGSAYKYWKAHNKNLDRKKKDNTKSESPYWLVSPRSDNSESVWLVNKDGSADTALVDNTNGVSFAFCI